MNVLLHQQDVSGKVAITCACADHDLSHEVSKVVPDGAVYEIVDSSTVPTDCTFRDAWRWAGVGSAITTDIPAAREIALTHARIIATAKLKREKDEELLGTDVQATIAGIQTEYQTCQVSINSSEDLEVFKSTLDDFSTCYGTSVDWRTDGSLAAS